MTHRPALPTPDEMLVEALGPEIAEILIHARDEQIRAEKELLLRFRMAAEMPRGVS